jgi:hypothetical protein
MFHAMSPGYSFLIHQDPHQFHDPDGGMGIVQLDSHLVGEIGKVIRMSLLVSTNDVLQGGGNEEVFLLQPQFLALEHVVVGVQNFRDGFRMDLVGNGLLVVSVIEVTQLEVAGTLGSPEAEIVHRMVSVSRYGNIVRHGHHLLGIHPFVPFTTPFIDELPDLPVEVDRIQGFGAIDFPGVPIPQPGIGGFHLFSVADPLEEDPVLVPNPVPVGGEA